MADPVEYPYYTQAIVLTFLSGLSVIVQIPPALWHFRHRNLAATTLVCWLIIQNLMIFINSLIWPTDDLENWWRGAGFCDVQVHILIFTFVSCAGCVLCIMQGLARVLDTDDVIVAPSRARRMRRAAVDVFWCFGLPTVMTGVYYVVQNIRYYVYGIVGCVASFDSSWLGVLLMPTPPLIIGLTAALYATLILYRTFRYRKEFSRMLAASNTTPSRFLRLFIICAFFMAGILPYQAYMLYVNMTGRDFGSYSWTRVHGPDWNVTLLVASDGVVLAEYWITVALGYALFAFFGLGDDAMAMYRAWARRLRSTCLCRCLFWPRSRHASGSRYGGGKHYGGGSGAGAAAAAAAAAAAYTRANSVSTLASKACSVLSFQCRATAASWLRFWRFSSTSPATPVLPSHNHKLDIFTSTTTTTTTTITTTPTSKTAFTDPFATRRGSASTTTTTTDADAEAETTHPLAPTSPTTSAKCLLSISDGAVFPEEKTSETESAAAAAAETAAVAKQKREKALAEAREMEVVVAERLCL